MALILQPIHLLLQVSGNLLTSIAVCEPPYVNSYYGASYIPCLLSSVVTTSLSTGLIAGIGVVCVVVILLAFLTGCGVGVIVLVVYQKKSKQSTSMLNECILLILFIS